MRKELIDEIKKEALQYGEFYSKEGVLNTTLSEGVLREIKGGIAFAYWRVKND